MRRIVSFADVVCQLAVPRYTPFFLRPHNYKTSVQTRFRCIIHKRPIGSSRAFRPSEWQRRPAPSLKRGRVERSCPHGLPLRDSYLIHHYKATSPLALNLPQPSSAANKKIRSHFSILTPTAALKGTVRNFPQQNRSNLVTENNTAHLTFNA